MVVCGTAPRNCPKVFIHTHEHTSATHHRATHTQKSAFIFVDFLFKKQLMHISCLQTFHVLEYINVFQIWQVYICTGGLQLTNALSQSKGCKRRAEGLGHPAGQLLQ